MSQILFPTEYRKFWEKDEKDKDNIELKENADTLNPVSISRGRWVWIETRNRIPSTIDGNNVPNTIMKLILAVNTENQFYDLDLGFIAKVPILTATKEATTNDICYQQNTEMSYLTCCYIRKQWFYQYIQSSASRECCLIDPTELQWHEEEDFKIGIPVGKDYCIFKNLFNVKIKANDGDKDRDKRIHSERNILMILRNSEMTYVDCFFSRHLRKGKQFQINALGEVYLGEHTVPTNGGTEVSPVVIKSIRCKSCDTITSTLDLRNVYKPFLNENIINEVEIMSALGESLSASDPCSIARLCNIVQDGCNLFLITELARGGCLLDFMNSPQREAQGADYKLEEVEAKHIIAQVATTLSKMHSLGFVHQDLSTENILLHEDISNGSELSIMKSKAILADFGQSQRCSLLGNQSKMPSRPVGKLYYHAPEMVYKPCKPMEELHYMADKVDSWQLGILILILLTGQAPWDFQTKNCTSQSAWFDLVKTNSIGSLNVCWRCPKGPSASPRYEIKQLSDSISIEAMTLIQNLVQFNPNDRLTMEDVLKSPWLQSRH